MIRHNHKKEGDMILQKDLAVLLKIKKSNFSNLLAGKIKVSGQFALELEQKTGIDTKVWLRGGRELRGALENKYGPINTERGRVKK